MQVFLSNSVVDTLYMALADVNAGGRLFVEYNEHLQAAVCGCEPPLLADQVSVRCSR